jgi:hypothetical protein
MCITAVSFFKVRLKKRELEFQNIVESLGLQGRRSGLAPPTMMDEYFPADYWLPVGFATLICACGFTHVFFGADLIAANYGKQNLLLTGFRVAENKDAMQAFRWQNMVVIGLAFTGAFIFSAQCIFRRLITGDLTPSSYYGAGLRIIYAVVVALMLSALIEAVPAKDYSKAVLPILAFLAGMMPEEAFLYLKERSGIFSTEKSGKSHTLPLSMLEGINAFHGIRLSEVGIDNAQNLAEANLIDLILKTPYQPSILLDWIGQAKLYVHFGSDLDNLRRMGIRTIFDFRTVCAVEERRAQIAAEAGVSSLKVALVCHKIEDDEEVARLMEFRTRLCSLALKERSPSICNEQSPNSRTHIREVAA